jgi:citrate lyase beta subunit/acyl dehydratase
MHEKALGARADEVVFDLEDAVPIADKAAARDAVLQTLTSQDWLARRVAVRVNAADRPEHAADLQLCAELVRDGFSIVVPKVERPCDLAGVERILSGGVQVQALIETPRALLDAVAIAEEPIVGALILGYADLGAALGRRGVADDRDAWRVQQSIVVAAARAAGVRPIDGPYFRLSDSRGLASATHVALAAGFDGKWAIHPEQVLVINDVFAASAAERVWAEDVVARVDERGVSTVGGAMVDEAMVRHARRLLQLPTSAVERVDGVASVAAPYYDDLAVGDTFDAPGLTITPGHAAVHQAVVGDRLRLALDSELFAAVTGSSGLLAHPMLVCDIAIGQSTAPTGRVLGNLFYRGLGCRPVRVGTTLRTRTAVVGRRDVSGGRGIVVLRVTTTDGNGDVVLDFWRCPLLPARDRNYSSGGHDDLSTFGHGVDGMTLVPSQWSLAPLRESHLGPLFADLAVGDTYAVESGETITTAPELARLTLNLAMAHTDAGASTYPERLVYGGHVIGVAAAHVTRALPDLATILAWESCDHVGPAFEGDVLRSRITVSELAPLPDGGLVHLHVHVTAQAADDGYRRDVLEWKLVGLMP